MYAPRLVLSIRSFVRCVFPSEITFSFHLRDFSLSCSDNILVTKSDFIYMKSLLKDLFAELIIFPVNTLKMSIHVIFLFFFNEKTTVIISLAID